MSAFANLVINDGATVPVAHTFKPAVARREPDGSQMWQWLDFSGNGGYAIGANEITLASRMPRAPGSGRQLRAGDAGQNLVITGRIRLPTLETLSGSTLAGITAQPTWAFDDVLHFKMIRNGRSPTQQVKHLEAYLKNLVTAAVFTDMARDYSMPTG